MNGKIGLDVDRLSWRSEEQVTVADVSEVSILSQKIYSILFGGGGGGGVKCIIGTT